MEEKLTISIDLSREMADEIMSEATGKEALMKDLGWETLAKDNVKLSYFEIKRAARMTGEDGNDILSTLIFAAMRKLENEQKESMENSVDKETELKEAIDKISSLFRKD